MYAIPFVQQVEGVDKAPNIENLNESRSSTSAQKHGSVSAETLDDTTACEEMKSEEPQHLCIECQLEVQGAVSHGR